MLLKDKSTTKSSKSATNNNTDTPVQFVKGVGPRLAAVFAHRDIHTVRDLLTFFPRAYEDRSKLLRVSELREGMTATVGVQVTGMRKIPTRFGRTIFEVRCRDESGMLALKWFNLPRGMDARFKAGLQLVVTGPVKFYQGHPEITHPEITWNASGHAEEARDYGRVVPVYTEIEGIPSRSLRKILWEALEKYSTQLIEDLPEKYRATHKLPRLHEAVRTIHFPEEGGPAIDDLIGFRTPSHARLIYEEFFKFEYLVLRQRLHMEREKAPAINGSNARVAVADLTKHLPFKLTDDQQLVVDEILIDLGQPHPMNRLIQGDVGSGKTAVAFLAAGAVIAEGGQIALMAPTEILAEQHYRNALKLFGPKLNPHLLTGKSTTSERNTLLAKLAAGVPMLLIGTHALIEAPVIFKNLVTIMIDEQHRFGVEQRRALRMKGTRTDNDRPVYPHTLVLSATPIPRTLALTAYGDLSISTIKQMPPGRSPILTRVVRGDTRTAALERIRSELRNGRQAYFIYPLVNDSEAEGFTNLKSAVAEAERLAREVFPEFKVGLLHGQLKPDEKAAVMERFKNNELQILVSTTVVEVGVDVPNATIMAVEHSERFGLSQLHQLRGRVGRGTFQSYCFFFSSKYVGETSNLRLEVLEETTDGFKIAEADLEIRGPGEFLGTRQAGGLPFRMAQIVRDREWLFKARDDAQSLLRNDPNLELPEHISLRRYYDREGLDASERLKTS